LPQNHHVELVQTSDTHSRFSLEIITNYEVKFPLALKKETFVLANKKVWYMNWHFQIDCDNLKLKTLFGIMYLLSFFSKLNLKSLSGSTCKKILFNLKSPEGTSQL